MSGSRRVSKTFRKFPEIVVDPPQENITASLPDISASFMERENLNPSIGNVNEKNLSCPNLADETMYESFSVNLRVLGKDFNSSSLETSMESLNDADVTKKTKLERELDFNCEYNIFSNWKRSYQLPSGNLTYVEELDRLQKETFAPNCFKLRNRVARRKLTPPVDFLCSKRETRYFWTDYPSVECPQPKDNRFFWTEPPKDDKKRKFSCPVPKYKKHSDVTPSDILKRKMKQSVSMHNLFLTPQLNKRHNFDSYHTIHSDSNYPRMKNPFDLDLKKFGSFDAIREQGCSENVFNPFASHLEPDRSFFGRLSSSYIFDSDDSLKFDGTSSAGKCCCGRTKCKAVVPIQQYLETYFDRRVRHTLREVVWFLRRGKCWTFN